MFMRQSPRHGCKVRWTWLLLLAAMLSGRAALPAGKPLYQLDIPRQSVRAALSALAAQTSAQLLFPYDIAKDRESNAVLGRYTLEQALALLLQGVGLAGSVTDSGVITISLGDGGPHAPAAQRDSMAPASAAAPPPAAGSAAGTRQSAAEGRPKGLDEVIVTAEKRKEGLQRVPIAISSFSGAELDARGIESLETLQQIAPSLQLGFKEGSFAKLSMRGVGNDLLGVDVEPAVAVIQDGVPYASQWVSLINFFDTERVEVLRGPQGTISGRNATGGAILIRSKAPADEFQAGTLATLGNYNRIAADSYVSGPLAGPLLLGRIAVRVDHADGWARNTLLDQQLGNRDLLQARGTLVAKFDNLDAHLIVESLRDHSRLFFVDYGRVRADTPTLSEYYGLPGYDPQTKTVAQDQRSGSEVKRTLVTLDVGWDISPSVHLDAISGYVESTLALQSDLDGSAVPAIVETPPTPLIHIAQISQEATLTADVTQRLDVIAGVLFLKQNTSNVTIFGAPLLGVPAGGYHYDEHLRLDSWGLYTQWRYRFSERLRLSAGVRHISDAKARSDYSVLLGVPVPENNRASWNAWTPRVALDYSPRERLTLYASYSEGFKAGGFDSLSAPVLRFKPETVRNYEVGAKGTWFDGRINTALTGFYMDYRDIQESVLGVAPNAYTVRVTNLPSATIKGFEFETKALLSERWLLTFASALLDARYGRLYAHDTVYPELGSVGASGLTLRDATGNQLVRAPKFQYNVSAQYTQPLSPTLKAQFLASYAWQARAYFDYFNHPGQSQDAYGLTDLSAVLATPDDRWRVTAFVRNLTDQFYITAKPIQPTGPVPIGVGHPGVPRTFGLSLDYQF